MSSTTTNPSTLGKRKGNTECDDKRMTKKRQPSVLFANQLECIDTDEAEKLAIISDDEYRTALRTMERLSDTLADVSKELSDTVKSIAQNRETISFLKKEIATQMSESKTK